MQTTTLSLFRFDSLSSRAWVLGQMGAARLSFRRMPQALFWKLCGSGSGQGFTPRPNWAVWAIFAVWPDHDTAAAQVAEAGVYRRWRARAGESWTVFLAPTKARGLWAGVNPFAIEAEAEGPVAVLTRASIRLRHLRRFWGQEPGISAAIAQNPDVAFKIGIGELPMLHQVTFSLWPDPAAMAGFARGDSPHGRAIRAVRDGQWFREELYARFRILGATGTWGGENPLLRLDFPVAA
jgi:spheroidene monooxygenase